MTAGLPGAGIGGLFYFCLVFLMPVWELYLTARGRSSLARWKHVAFQYSLVLTIFAALWAEAWAIKSTLNYMKTIDGWFGRWITQLMEFTGFMMLGTGQFVAIASLATLAFVCLAAASLNVAAKLGWIEARKAIPVVAVAE
jgi:hypothetical protein